MNMLPSRWSLDAAALAADQPAAALPVIAAAEVVPLIPGHDVWDMWPIAHPDGRTAILDGREWWFFLATPCFADPEDRHDAARIVLTSHGAEGWRDHGPVFSDDFTPGSREWSGSAILDDGDGVGVGVGVGVTMYFTAAGRRGEARTFEQRLFETRGRFAGGRLGDWTTPVESVVADGMVYARADQTEPENGGIKGFRDPGYFRDPADGAEYLLFVGSAGRADDPSDGVVGVARREGTLWTLCPPLVEAISVNRELERPHIVVRAGLYYLFWSTQAKRFAPGLHAPTGLYGMVADGFAGPWRPLNGSGLVAANPPDEPFQAYCWWVTGEAEVISFVDYWGTHGIIPPDAATRRARFGGTVAPRFSLRLDGESAMIV